MVIGRHRTLFCQDLISKEFLRLLSKSGVNKTVILRAKFRMQYEDISGGEERWEIKRLLTHFIFPRM